MSVAAYLLDEEMKCRAQASIGLSVGLIGLGLNSGLAPRIEYVTKKNLSP